MQGTKPVGDRVTPRTGTTSFFNVGDAREPGQNDAVVSSDRRNETDQKRVLECRLVAFGRGRVAGR